MVLASLPTIGRDGTVQYAPIPRELPMAETLVRFRSGNGKTGPMPVTARPQSTCPHGCPLRGSGCYGENRGANGRPSMFGQVVASLAGLRARATLDDLISRKWRKVPPAIRFNTVGDYLRPAPDGSEVVDRAYIRATNRVASAFDWVAWSYTHAWGRDDLRPSDFTYVVRASCQSVEELRDAHARGWYAAVVDTGPDEPDTLIGSTVDGRRVVQCPVTVKGRTGGPANCAECRLCGRRTAVIAFPVHGVRARAALRAVRAIRARSGSDN